MKKIILIIGVVLVLFIIVLYWSLNSTPENFKTSTVVNLDTIDSINFKDYDSLTIAASTLYKANDLKKLMQGEHYRDAWSTPIKVKVAFLDTLLGGLTVIEEGGGNQTKSLKLEDSIGNKYTLRSVNKTPAPLVPEFAKTLGLENIIVDGISAQHPYAATVVASLAEAAHVQHTAPKLYFIPKQDALKDYNDTYGNKLFLFEHETESSTNWTSIKNVTEIVETDDLQLLKLERGKTLKIDEHALVRARLFDLVIGDWDRHAKQWGWIIKEEQNGQVAIPLPADRDNAFFNISGIIPSILANKNVTPEMRPFDKDIDYMPGLIHDFDVYFLKSTEEAVFIEEAQQLQHLLTDSVIENALRLWPSQLYDLDGKTIENKLKSRRDELLIYAKAFKRILNEKEYPSKPLKGSEDLELNGHYLKCFECY
ncbi:hypothetical protein LX77_00509 [Gelidibacter algens]|jgi:hypothetical protein|uniref:Uncharacterized protein n=1 Tax=Gelidibacter algens TaxID=49280 RepID=A0A327SHB2_9FLAO|nr:hypothetical protein [Gelidibacter algens]RAJ27935.1 hypothetical protein LX77_00509 [Gelidibacter algens]